MRIRKNAEISPLFYMNLDFPTRGLECELNQSPWDVITFPTSPESSFLVPYDHDNDNTGLDGNKSLGNSTKSAESDIPFIQENDEKYCNEKCVDGVKNVDFEKTKMKKNAEKKIQFEESDKGVERGVDSPVEEELKLCTRRDRKGWQCGQVVKNGRTACDYHFEQLQNHSLSACKRSKMGKPSSHRADKRIKAEHIALEGGHNENEAMEANVVEKKRKIKPTKARSTASLMELD